MKDSWDECGLQAKLDLMNYYEVFTHDETKFELELAQIGLAKSILPFGGKAK